MEMPVEQMMPQGDPEKALKKLLAWTNENMEHAKQQTQKLWDECDAVEAEFRAKYGEATRENAGEIGQQVEIREATNQTQVVSAIMAKQWLTSQGYRVQATNGESQTRADTTKMVMDYCLAKKDFPQHIRKFFLRFNKYDFAAMKVCVWDDLCPVTKEIIVPNMELEQTIAQLEADQKVFEVVGPFDEDSSGASTQTLILVTEEERDTYPYMKAVEIRNLAFSDPNHPTLQEQFSIHEFHYFTREQLQYSSKFHNVEKLNDSDAGNDYHPSTTSNISHATGENIRPKNAKAWEIVESHQCIPWQQWFMNGDVKIEDAYALATLYGWSPSQFDIQQKWIFFHHKDKVGLFLAPTYMEPKNMHCYFGCSHSDGDGELQGEGFFRKIQPLSNIYNELANRYFDNIRARSSMSCFTRVDGVLTPEKLKEAATNNYKVVDLELNQASNVKDEVLFMSEVIPDITTSIMPMLQFVRGEGQVQGVPASLQGQGKADTATQDVINTQRGQDRVDDPFARAVDCVIAPCLRAIRDLVFKYWTKAKWITVTGEYGVGMTRWVNRKLITNRFEIVPIPSYDFVSRNQKTQSIIMAMNIASRIMDPIKQQTIITRLLGLFLEYSGETRDRIDYITDKQGLGTNPDEEIEVMRFNPEEPMADKVRMDDNHILALFSAQRALQQYPYLAMQPNFNEWIQKHMEMFEASFAMQGMAAPAMPGGPGMQPNPNPPMEPESQTREQGQRNSAPDGGQSAAGLTGMAMPSAVQSKLGMMDEQ